VFVTEATLGVAGGPLDVVDVETDPASSTSSASVPVAP
jgi:hypothetical protein